MKLKSFAINNSIRGTTGIASSLGAELSMYEHLIEFNGGAEGR